MKLFIVTFAVVFVAFLGVGVWSMKYFWFNPAPGQRVSEETLQQMRLADDAWEFVFMPMVWLDSGLSIYDVSIHSLGPVAVAIAPAMWALLFALFAVGMRYPLPRRRPRPQPTAQVPTDGAG